jgi:hypothetical protein
MAMKFRKISTISFKRNYGSLFFLMKILSFSFQACSGYTWMKSAILDFRVECSVITSFLDGCIVISVFLTHFYLFRYIGCSTELLSEGVEATSLCDNELN